jgi:hypothetical protein
MPVPKREGQNPDSCDRDFPSGLERLQIELGFRGPFVGPDRIVEDVGNRSAPAPASQPGRDRGWHPLPHREDAEIVDPLT